MARNFSQLCLFVTNDIDWGICMHKLLSRTVAVFISINMIACTSLRAVPDWQTQNAAALPSERPLFKVGDEVRLGSQANNQTTLLLTAVDPDALTGIAPESKESVRIPLDQVTAVEVRRFDGVKTALLVVLVVLGIIGVGLSQMSISPGVPPINPFP
jgi:hypothetical protein